MATVLLTLDLESSDSKIDCTFTQAIHLNLQKYRYFLKLLSVTFANVFKNVDISLEVNGTVFASPGIYSIEDLIKAYNQSAGAGKMGLNTNTGKLFIENDGGSNLTITSSNFLQSNLGGNFTLPVTLTPGQIIYSNTVPIISSYNYFILTSQSIHNNAYSNNINDNIMTPTNILYSFSSAIEAFHLKTWVSVEPVEFEISQNILNKVDFEIRTGNDEGLENEIVPGSSTDFHIFAQIISIER